MTAEAGGNRTLAAAAAIVGYAVIIGYTDNYVRVIAAEMGLWQFHAMRSVMVALILLVAVPLLRLELAPRAWKRVAARSLVHGMGMLIYFGALAFLPVAQVAAGLFTAPIFVLLISRLAYGHPIGPVRIVAVAVGFFGILLVLKPGTGAPIGLASLVPVAAGFFYALGNIATREWCEGETAVTLTAGFFAALGFFGLIGMAILTVFPVAAPEGAAGFVMRGPVWPGLTASIWVFVQALGSLIGVGLMVRAYQMAEASRVAVFEYVVMPAAAFWGWLIWAEVPGPVQIAGMGLIVLAGLLIAFRRR
jgi:drug/metabolite transporter (DMT)-like permease